MAGAPPEGSHNSVIRETAERVERGIERYAEGDVAASAREFEEALKLQPGHPRAHECLEWVKALQAGTRTIDPGRGKLDADLLDVVADALSPPLDEARRPGTRDRTPAAASAGTILGVNPPDRALLTPDSRRPLHANDETTASRRREWPGEPTGANLPPLDVPELSDEQVRELLAPKGAPHLIELEAEPGASEFDTFEQTPTHGGGDEPLLQLVPLSGESDGEGGSQTNPFIKNKLAEYAAGAPPPNVDDLPAAPGSRSPDIADRTASKKPGYSTNQTAALEPIEGLGEALDRGDVNAALALAEAFVAAVGGVDAEAARPQAWLLERTYEAQVGPLGRVPAHGQAAPDLDPRAAFLLSRIDGMSTAEDLLEVSGMPRLQALRVLALLVRRGVVAMR